MPNALLPPSLQLSINPISPALPCIPNTKSTRQGFAAVTEVTASCNTRIPRRSVLSVAIGGSLLQILAVSQAEAVNSGTVPEFYNLEGGVKALDIREGKGRNPHIGDKVFIHYYGRIAAKQGWRFDSTYEHKDNSGDPQPFSFYVGSSSRTGNFRSEHSRADNETWRGAPRNYSTSTRLPKYFSGAFTP